MIKKIKYIILFSLLIILGICTKSQGRITTSDPTVQSGETATITINSQEPVANGAIDVTSNGGLTFSSVSGGTANGTKVAFAGAENKTNGIATYKFKVPEVTKTTKYQIVFQSYDMGNAEGENIASSTATATVTVKAKPTSNNSGSGSSGNSSSGSSGNSGKQQTPAPSFSSVNETVYATTSVNVRSSYSTSSSVVGSLNEGDSVTRIGKGSNGWSRVTYNGQTAYINSDYLTTKKPVVESSNNDLKSLKIEQYELVPEFDPEVTEYSMKISENSDALIVDAEAEDEKAEVKITGNDELLTGENVIEIVVTAEDGSTKKYTINVTKGEELKTSLSELNVAGYTLTPEFDSSVYEYTLEVNDLNVKSLEISAKANVEDADIEILGNEELKQGENIITILVKSNNNEEVLTYQIVVTIQEAAEVPAEENQIIPGIANNDLYLYGGIGIGVLIVLIIIIVVIAKRRNKDDDDFGSYYGNFDSLEKAEKKEKKRKQKEENKETVKDDNNEEIIKNNLNTNIDTEDDEDRQKVKRGKHF